VSLHSFDTVYSSYGHEHKPSLFPFMIKSILNHILTIWWPQIFSGPVPRSPPPPINGPAVSTRARTERTQWLVWIWETYPESCCSVLELLTHIVFEDYLVINVDAFVKCLA
jgi:hypothetical protein